MEKNTVILDAETYNQLRDFRTNIEKGNTAFSYNGYTSKTFITTNDAISSVIADNNSLKKMNDAHKEEVALLWKKIDELKSPKEKEITIEEIQKMNIFEFAKWKKTKNK